MPFNFKLAARTEPLWNGKAGNNRASRVGSGHLSRKHGAFADQPLEKQWVLLSCSHCWVLPGILQDPKVKGQFRNSERISPWKKFSRFPRAKESQTFIYHGILSTLLTFFKKPSKLTLLSDHHPNSLYSASGHSKEKTEHKVKETNLKLP